MKSYLLTLTMVVFLGVINSQCQLDSQVQSPLPEGFVYVKDSIPSVEVELRYLGPNNFVGAPVDGYVLPRAIATAEAVEALKLVSEAMAEKNLRIKIFDSYRPQRAVDHFVRWAEDLSDTLTRSVYYPEIDKSELFEKHYIASKSSHTRGSTFDLTLVDSRGVELDMGTPWDYFGPKSWPTDTTVSAEAYENRMLLRNAMMDAGFAPYNEEWWHFTLKKEPYPNTYFDFEVR
ncbi:MAG: M15 family metallopeptidase [Schleiferiaceae bacterium]